jgi:hypothetical protein
VPVRGTKFEMHGHIWRVAGLVESSSAPTRSAARLTPQPSRRASSACASTSRSCHGFLARERRQPTHRRPPLCGQPHRLRALFRLRRPAGFRKAPSAARSASSEP